MSLLSVERAHLEARDEDAVCELIDRLYTTHRTTFRPAPGEAPHARVSSTTAGVLRADRASRTFEAESDLDPTPGIEVGRVVGGRMRFTIWGDEHALGPGDAALWPAGVPARHRGPAVDAAFLSLPFERVAEVAERLGVRPTGFRFTGVRPASAALARHWTRTLDLVFAALHPPEPVAAHPLVNQTLFEAVAVATLTTFPNTALTADHLPTPGWEGPRTLERATTFLQEHVADPITLEDVAAASGTGARALQHAFRRYRGTTPMAYLRDLRVARAHADLRAADPDGPETVADIARRWGFPRTGRFVDAYRRAYGCSPGETLRG